MQYTVDYFIKKFKGIPQGKWRTFGFIGGDGTFCAMGHCGLHGVDCWPLNEEATALRDFFGTLQTVFDINDGKDSEYQQPTPKQRILAALRDIKKMQESSKVGSKEPDVQECDTTKPIVVQELGQYKNISKQIAVLPVDEKSDVKMVKA